VHRVSEIVAVAITLEVASEHVLFILPAADGTVNRAGAGLPGNTESTLFIGQTSEPLFQSLLGHLTDEMFKFTGTYDVPDKRGDPCRLSIALTFADGSEDGFGFAYGALSQGPPREIASFVRKAGEITEAWYQARLRSTKKPWWRFW